MLEKLIIPVQIYYRFVRGKAIDVISSISFNHADIIISIEKLAINNYHSDDINF